MDNGNYFKFGVNTPVEKDLSDPVQCCLAGRYLNCPENALRFDATMCNNYMVQRCANKWDDKCDLFLKQNYERDIVRNYGDETFIEEAAARKYCVLDKSDPKAKCIELCEPLNPVAQISPQVCSIYGTEIFTQSKKLYDIAGDFPATAKLNNTSPIKISKCPITCNKVSKIEKDDKVMDLCLETGKCQAVLENLAQYVVKNNIPVENEGFKKWMSNYIIRPVISPKVDTTTTTSSPIKSTYGVEEIFDQKEMPDHLPKINTMQGQPAQTFSEVQTFVDPRNNLVVMTKCDDKGIKLWLGILCAILVILIYVMIKNK